MDEILDIFQQLANPLEAPKMEAYMKHKFSFLGLKSPIRRQAQKAFLRDLCANKTVDWDFVQQCFASNYREFQYLAIDYLVLLKKYIKAEDINILEQLVCTKSWWDSVDALSQIIGFVVLKNPAIKENELNAWIHSDNMWLARVAIIHQLGYREKTDTHFLERAICENFGEKEFFINKAIGWSLREYSKHNKAWVQNFLVQYRVHMHPLSVREASKYL